MQCQLKVCTTWWWRCTTIRGISPLKLLGFYDGVNITAGLPFIRTSADHGTAFDIAWTGKAKSESMATSIELAMHIAQAGIT